MTMTLITSGVHPMISISSFWSLLIRIQTPMMTQLTRRQNGSVLKGSMGHGPMGPGIHRGIAGIYSGPNGPYGVKAGFRGNFLDFNYDPDETPVGGDIDYILNDVEIGSPAHSTVPMYVDCRKIKAASLREFNLHPLGRTIFNEDNLSDSSLASEAYSAHVMGHLFEKIGVKSKIYLTETNVKYKYSGSKKTDYVVETDKPIDGLNIIAVEVKRLSDFDGKVDLTDYYIHNLLSKANKGALESNRTVHPSNRWHTQVLHVITNVPGSVDVIRDWCQNVSVAGFSWVFVTVVLGNHKVVMTKV